MLNEYIEHLRQLNTRLKRNGIVLPLNFDCDVDHLAAQVNVLEQFLYFNQVLKVADSSYKIESLLDFDDVLLSEFLRNEIYEKYEAEWNRTLLELTKQPEDAGVLNKEIKVISRREAELFTESLGLVREEETSKFDEPEFKPIWGSSPDAFDFDDEEDEEDEDEADFDDYDIEGSSSPFEFDDDEEEDSEDDTDDMDNSSDDLNSDEEEDFDDEF